MVDFERWNRWRKGNLNGPLHHLLVLFGVVNSPTFNLTLTKEELDKWNEIKTMFLEPNTREHCGQCGAIMDEEIDTQETHKD